MVERSASALPGRAARHERQRGFSLVELLIATLVGSATLGAAVLITDQVSRGYTSQLDGAMVQEEARFAPELDRGGVALGRQQSVRHRGVELPRGRDSLSRHSTRPERERGDG